MHIYVTPHLGWLASATPTGDPFTEIVTLQGTVARVMIVLSHTQPLINQLLFAVSLDHFDDAATLDTTPRGAGGVGGGPGGGTGGIGGVELSQGSQNPPKCYGQARSSQSNFWFGIRVALNRSSLPRSSWSAAAATGLAEPARLVRSSGSSSRLKRHGPGSQIWF